MKSPKKTKIVLYNPEAVFYTMPLALLCVGSALDPDQFDVRIIDGRLEEDPVRAVLDELRHALCLSVSVITGAPKHALHLDRGHARRPGTSAVRRDLCAVRPLRVEARDHRRDLPLHRGTDRRNGPEREGNHGSGHEAVMSPQPERTA
ncbi:MAG: hypothetical protein ACYTG7_02145 [Planctomycetota bacterium]|jgi:hypothetical protein